MVTFCCVLLLLLTSIVGAFRNGIDTKAAFDFKNSISAEIYDHLHVYNRASVGRSTIFTLHAALSLQQSMDLIKETVLLSDVIGHYVKDIQSRGRNV